VRRKKRQFARKRTCSGKVRYRDAAEAHASLHRQANYSTRDKIPVRAYECDECAGWHVTSKEQWVEPVPGHEVE
jgi:hypothetical protein